MTFPKQQSPSQSPPPINLFASEKEIRERLTLADLDDAAIDAVAAAGTMKLSRPSSAESTQACEGPAPPLANSEKSRGS